MNLSIRNRHCSIAFMSSYFFWRELFFDWRASICFWRFSTMLSQSEATSLIDFSFKVAGHNSGLLYSVTASSNELLCRMSSCITRVLLDLWYVLAANIVGILFLYVFFPPGIWAEHTLWLEPGLHKPLVFNSLTHCFFKVVSFAVLWILVTKVTRY